MAAAAAAAAADADADDASALLLPSTTMCIPSASSSAFRFCRLRRAGGWASDVYHLPVP